MGIQKRLYREVEAKIDRKQGGWGKKESETKPKELRRSNKREYVQVENSRILTSAQTDGI